ncbi:MAG: RteC domain-containing protein [Chitinophagaceae bacterium]
MENFSDPFCRQLYQRLETNLEQISQEEDSLLQLAERSQQAAWVAMEQLRDHYLPLEFSTPSEEIFFFKRVKPLFFSQLIYFVKLYHIEKRRPSGYYQWQEQFLQTEWGRLKIFFEINQDFCRYYRKGDSFLDEQYFLRNRPDGAPAKGARYFDADPRFSASHDYKTAQLLAYEKLGLFLQQQLHALDPQKWNPFPFAESENALRWTGSKTDLIELLYALQSAGVFNQGQADLKQVGLYLEKIFHVDLGNYYRTFQEIRLRKKSRTSFLDQLSKILVRRMEITEEIRH